MANPATFRIYDGIVALILDCKDKLAITVDLGNEELDIVESEIESWQRA